MPVDVGGCFSVVGVVADKTREKKRGSGFFSPEKIESFSQQT